MESGKNVKNTSKLYTFSKHKNLGVAEAFPFNTQIAAEAVNHYQMVKLSKASVKALKRG